MKGLSAMRFVVIALLLFAALCCPVGAQPPTPTPPIGQPIGTPTATAAPAPTLRDAQVVWQRPDRAVVSWQSSAPMLCVGKYDVATVWRFLACDARQVVDDAPQAGDAYLILANGQILARLPLRSRVYLPALRR